MRVTRRFRARGLARSVWRGALSVVLLALALTACGGGNNDSATATPGIQPTTEPPTVTIGPSTPGNFANGATELGRIVWASKIDENTKAPLDQVDSIKRDAPAIYAVLPVVRLSPDTQISAQWDLDGTPVPTLSTTINGSALPKGGWVEFHLMRTTNLFWPLGTFHVRVFVNGQPAQEATVQIKPLNQ